MTFRNYLFAVIVMLGCARPLSGYGSQLGFGHAVFNKDTLHIGDTLRITSYVHNFDTTGYNDYISFGLKINGVQNVNQVLFPNPYYDQIVNINPGDSIIANMTIIITSAYFELGPDILVVWPIAPDGSLPVLSIDSSIFVEKPVGINDLANTPQLKVYYADKFIRIQAEQAQITLIQVCVYDLNGREVLHETTDGRQPIPFNSQANGIYLVTVRFYNGQQALYRVVKQ